MHIRVIIPAFDVAAFLGGAIVSVVNQTHKDWSLVVVDDGSADNPGAIVTGFPDQRISLIRQNNAGVSAARNVGLRALPAAEDLPPGTNSTSEAVLFLDGDDWLAPNALTLLAGALEDAPRAVAACGRYARVPANGALRLFPAPPDGCLLERLLTRNLFANGGHMLIRRTAIETAGEFRQDLSYGEDWEYWTRLALLGEFVSVVTRDPLLFVRERPGSAYLSRAADSRAYRPVMEAIHGNRAITDRLGSARMACLRRRAEAETAWAVGRELIRHGHRRDGQRWLGRSIRIAPSLKRLAIAGLASFRVGPFRPYRTSG